MNLQHGRSAKKQATISLIGRDKTGVIARVTNYLFERGANIESLEEQVKRGEFSMVLEASWTRWRFEPPVIQKERAELARSLKMKIRIYFKEQNRRQRMAIMVTSEPCCLEALLNQCRPGRLRVDPVVVLSNRTDLAPIAE